MKKARFIQNEKIKTFSISLKNGQEFLRVFHTFLLPMLGLFVLMTFSSCEEKEDMDDEVKMSNFTLSIENVFESKHYFMAGATEGIGPGNNYSFTFDAGKGHYLSFATMLAQSNDLFFGFQDKGLALYDDMGNPVSGIVTNQVYLWDAGTEVNQEPGKGADQAPRQSAANTGTAENGMVKMITAVGDGFTYPIVSDLIKIMISHDGGTMFSVTIFNMSNSSSLVGPLAPGVWAIHSDDAQLYTENMAASAGLERLSEDGNNTELKDQLMMNAGLVSPFAPGVFAVYQGMNPIFKAGQMGSAALEALAEDGNPALYNFSTMADVSASGVFNTPKGSSSPAPIFPWEKYEVSFQAMEGDVLSFATMLVQSNDLFIAPEGISLFSGGVPMTGDITMYLKIWDAGTEKNEYPGAGNNQAPRQAGSNTGDMESGTVMLVNDGFSYPTMEKMMKITLTAN